MEDSLPSLVSPQTHVDRGREWTLAAAMSRGRNTSHIKSNVTSLSWCERVSERVRERERECLPVCLHATAACFLWLPLCVRRSGTSKGTSLCLVARGEERRGKSRRRNSREERVLSFAPSASLLMLSCESHRERTLFSLSISLSLPLACLPLALLHLLLTVRGGRTKRAPIHSS